MPGEPEGEHGYFSKTDLQLKTKNQILSVFTLHETLCFRSVSGVTQTPNSFGLNRHRHRHQAGFALHRPSHPPAAPGPASRRRRSPEGRPNQLGLIRVILSLYVNAPRLEGRRERRTQLPRLGSPDSPRLVPC